MHEELKVLPSHARDATEIERDVLVMAQALSDPIRLRILSLLIAGHACCDLSGCESVADADQEGICVCEFTAHFDLTQSKISYHLARLKAAGLVHEQRRGKWNYYSLDRTRAAEGLKAYQALFEFTSY